VRLLLDGAPRTLPDRLSGGILEPHIPQDARVAHAEFVDRVLVSQPPDKAVSQVLKHGNLLSSLICATPALGSGALGVADTCALAGRFATARIDIDFAELK
jgi:hypothetical protein